MTRNEQVEAIARAVHSIFGVPPWEDLDDVDRGDYLLEAEAALSAWEKAEPRRFTLHVCKCGLVQHPDSNSKYCPAGHAYQFERVQVMPVPAERGEDDA